MFFRKSNKNNKKAEDAPVQKEPDNKGSAGEQGGRIVEPKIMNVLDTDIRRIEKEIKKFKKHVEKSTPAAPVVVNVVSSENIQKKAHFLKDASKFVLSAIRSSFSLSFYFLSALVCVALLAYLFGSWKTLVFYFIFGMFLWWWSHQFHKSKSALSRSVVSLGLVIVLLYLAYYLFNDLLSLIFCCIYSLSFIIAGFLYFYHVKRELSGEIHQSFSRTFLVVFYSHVVAFALACFVAFLIPHFIISDSFMSISFLILAWFLPSVATYFFLAKFLYLRFFDRIHFLSDFLRGLAHCLVYSFIFAVLIFLAYMLTAIQLVSMEKDEYSETFNRAFTDLSNVQPDIVIVNMQSETSELLSLSITQDVLNMADSIMANATLLNRNLKRVSFSLTDYLSDNYFAVLAINRLSVSRIAGVAKGVEELKSDLLREYSEVNSFEKAGVFDDGSRTLGEHYQMLLDYSADKKNIYQEPEEFSFIRNRLFYQESYSDLMADGMLLDFNLLYNPDLSIIEKTHASPFIGVIYDLAYHTVIFRDLMVFVSRSMLLQVEETVDPYPVWLLDDDKKNESLKSSVLRYRIIMINRDSTLALSGSEGGYS